MITDQQEANAVTIPVAQGAFIGEGAVSHP